MVVFYIGITNFAVVPIVVKRDTGCCLQEVFSQGCLAGLSRTGNKSHLAAEVRGEGNLLDMTTDIHFTAISHSAIFCKAILDRSLKMPRQF